METKERTLWIDVLNIIACFSVLLLHSNHQSKSYEGEISFRWIYGLIIYTFFYFPVPIFFMLSGSTLIGRSCSNGIKQFYIRRFKRVVIPFIFWSFFYFFIGYFITHKYENTYSIHDFANDFINAKFNTHMWFFIPLFSIYISMPFIEKMLLNINKRMELLFLILSFLFLSLMPQICELCDINYFVVGSDRGIFVMGGNFLFYAVWGHFLQIDLKIKQRRMIYVMGGISCFIHFCGLFFLSIWDGKFNWCFLNYAYPTSVMMAIAVFVWFRYTHWESVLSKLHLTTIQLSFISSCSFGIYLIHRFIHNIGSHFGIPFQNHYIGFILTYFVAFCAIVIMKKIPIIRNIVP